MAGLQEESFLEQGYQVAVEGNGKCDHTYIHDSKGSDPIKLCIKCGQKLSKYPIEMEKVYSPLKGQLFEEQK